MKLFISSLLILAWVCRADAQCAATCVPNTGYPFPTCGCLKATDLNNSLGARVLSVATNAALLALPSTYSTAVQRLGFAAAGDEGGALYLSSASPCSLNGGAGDNGSQVKASDGGCWLASDAGLTDAAFGVLHNNVVTSATANSAALQNAFNWVAANNETLTMACGIAYFNNALTVPVASNYGIVDWSTCSTLIYNGGNATTDLITIGTASGESDNVVITGWTLKSSTIMTAGAGVHATHLAYSRIDPIVDGQPGLGNFYNSIWYDRDNIIYVPNVQMAGASHDVVLLSGDAGTPGFIDEIHFGSGKITPTNSQVGASAWPSNCVHIAGGTGDVTFDGVDIVGCRVDMTVDNSVNTNGNQAVILGPTSALDSNLNGNLVLNDSGSSTWAGGTKAFNATGWIASAGFLGVGNANADCVTVTNWTGGILYLNGYVVAGCKRHAVNDADTSATVEISPSESFYTIGGSGISVIASASGSPKIQITNPIVTLAGGQAFLDANSLTSTLPIIYGGIACSGSPTSGFTTNAAGQVTHC